jgi:hypothetical protein
MPPPSPAREAGVMAVILAFLDFQRDRRRERRHASPLNAPDQPDAPPPPAGPMLGTAPDAWGQSAPALDPRLVLHVLLSFLAYLFGTLVSLPLLLVPSRTVRYHALQSIGIDVLTFLWLIAGVVVGTFYVLVRFGGESSEPLPGNDPYVNVIVFGFFVVELLPRFYCLIQVVRRRPARVPLVWRLAASIAGRTARP